MSSTRLAVLPLVLVMIAGPQIVTAVLLATSERAKANSLAFLVGVASATTLSVLTFYAIVNALDTTGTRPDGQSETGVVDYLVIAALAILAVRVFLRREVTEPPAWMGRLQKANLAFSLGIGFLLFLLMPTDLITTFTVGSYLAHEDQPWWTALLFVALTTLAAGIPLLAVVALGERAERALPGIRTWMTENAWIVSEVVIVFFLLSALNGLRDG